jgi:membrane protein YqaA with SNARE-associated domain
MRATLHKIAEALLAYGPWGVFVLAIIDSIGVPLPAAIDGLLIGVAASSAHSPQTAYFTALLAVIGSAGGNAALFLMARQGNRLISKGGPPPGKRKRFREWFQRYGLLTVFLPAIVPFLPLPLKGLRDFRRRVSHTVRQIHGGDLSGAIHPVLQPGLPRAAARPRRQRLPHPQRLDHHGRSAGDDLPAGFGDAVLDRRRSEVHN